MNGVEMCWVSSAKAQPDFLLILQQQRKAVTCPMMSWQWQL